MATSESDDFESADEELDNRGSSAKRNSSARSRTVVDSETDDDTECTSMVRTQLNNSRNPSVNTKSDSGSPTAGAATAEAAPVPAETSVEGAQVAGKLETGHVPENVPGETSAKTLDRKPTKTVVSKSAEATGGDEGHKKTTKTAVSKSSKSTEEPENTKLSADETNDGKSAQCPEPDDVRSAVEEDESGNASSTTVMPKAISETTLEQSNDVCELQKSNSESCRTRKERPQRQQKPKEPRQLGAKKLGSKISSESPVKPPPEETVSISGITPEEFIRKAAVAEGKNPPLIEECWEGFDDIPSNIVTESLKKSKNPPEWDGAWDNPSKPSNVNDCWEDVDDTEMPEELKSNKKFKEVFKFDGWEGMDDDVDIPDELTEAKIQPVLDKLSTIGKDQEDKSGGWGWGGWGVSSLINSATAGVSTLTSHVSQGLTMLEETIGAPDPEELARDEKEEDSKSSDGKLSETPDTESQLSFGFGNLMSGVSSITKLVESTSNKVIAGGLDTLETIGKKTMEVLQDGDPGLKKKRAFFLNEGDKPILSQMLREAKEKADTEEKSLEERQLARKIHFESLFDDYQGLVHLEALEMLSKQCNIKMQQRMISLDADELTSLQETLDEVKELCDLGDEDDDEENDRELKERLKHACKDLGVNITYDKLLDHWEETRTYLSAGPLPSDREVFQKAISTLAQFTAFSVERFHKTAELLLIKERRSTVNEADALVQLTQILSGQIGVVANSFSDKLNEMAKTVENPEAVNTSITTIFLEAANASSYVQDAFKLLIPVLQVGAT